MNCSSLDKNLSYSVNTVRQNTSRSIVLSFACMVLTQFAAAQPSSSFTAPLTEHGHPDLQGIWFYGSITPFDRPIELGNQQSYSEAEASQLLNSLNSAEAQKGEALSPDRSAPEAGVAIAQEADHNFASSRLNPIVIGGKYRTSQIISPADGRLPLVPGGTDYFEALQAQGYGAFDGPETRPVSERCAGPNGGPMAPMIGWFYNANMQIIQTSDHIMILAEMNHDARIIPLQDTASEHNSPQWMGYSTAHWDNEVLVIESSGFRPEQSWFAFRMSEQLRVTERYELVSANEIYYSYTFTDPVIYSEAVTVEKIISRRGNDEQIYEYACHEGNYSFPSILGGARRLEQLSSDPQ